ncbi:hypothetical protein ACFQ9X_00715 [Catenulispora yoronensis]
MCLSEDIYLDFGDRGPSCEAVNDVRTDLSSSEGTVSVGLIINHRDGHALDFDQAEALAYALLSQVATARGESERARELSQSAFDSTHFAGKRSGERADRSRSHREAIMWLQLGREVEREAIGKALADLGISIPERKPHAVK